jgi:hypothetical protein
MQAMLTLVRADNGGALPPGRTDRATRYAGAELIYRVYGTERRVQMTAVVRGEHGPETWNYDAHIGKRLGLVRQWRE